MDKDIIKTLPYELIAQTVGIRIEILSNEYQNVPASEGQASSCHKVVFQVKEDDPDVFAIGILFTLSLMSFSYAAPRGYSENEFIPDEQWNLGYFMQGLDFERGRLRYYGDYVSGRMMKTDITYEQGGRVTLTAINRGKSADRWLTHLQGKPHIQEVKKQS
jgi:hypothetical protein